MKIPFKTKPKTRRALAQAIASCPICHIDYAVDIQPGPHSEESARVSAIQRIEEHLKAVHGVSAGTEDGNSTV